MKKKVIVILYLLASRSAGLSVHCSDCVTAQHPMHQTRTTQPAGTKVRRQQSVFHALSCFPSPFHGLWEMNQRIPNMCSAPGFKTPPKFHGKTHREARMERNCGRETEKARNLWPPLFCSRVFFAEFVAHCGPIQKLAEVEIQSEPLRKERSRVLTLRQTQTKLVSLTCSSFGHHRPNQWMCVHQRQLRLRLERMFFFTHHPPNLGMCIQM